MACRKNLLLIPALALVAGCYSGITGKVVDADTGKPIPRAVVVAQWTTTDGPPGLAQSKVYKTIETETNGEGVFSLPGVRNPTVEPPAMVIYNRGHVPWRNDGDFETQKTYDKVIWKNRETYRLKKWKPGYSKIFLDLFLNHKFVEIDSQHIPRFQRILMGVSIDSVSETQRKR